MGYIDQFYQGLFDLCVFIGDQLCFDFKSVGECIGELFLQGWDVLVLVDVIGGVVGDGDQFDLQYFVGDCCCSFNVYCYFVCLFYFWWFCFWCVQFVFVIV